MEEIFDGVTRSVAQPIIAAEEPEQAVRVEQSAHDAIEADLLLVLADEIGTLGWLRIRAEKRHQSTWIGGRLEFGAGTMAGDEGILG